MSATGGSELAAASGHGHWMGLFHVARARWIDPESGAPVFGAELLGDDAAEDASHDSARGGARSDAADAAMSEAEVEAGGVAVPFDASPYSMVDTMALGQLHHAFRLLRLSDAYVTRAGRLVGIVSRDALRRRLIEADARARSRPAHEPVDARLFRGR